MRNRKRVLAVMVIAGAAFATTLMIFPEENLKVEVEARSTDIGIRGITKVYSANLRNVGLRPVRVQICRYVTDALEPGASVAYSIERWNSTRSEWTPYRGSSKAEFCRPYPLGIIKGQLEQIWLWPTSRISTSDGAIQAADGLRIGDQLRFVLFPFNDDRGHISPPFTIDERPLRP
jgi:hypothetical protein